MPRGIDRRAYPDNDLSREGIIRRLTMDPDRSGDIPEPELSPWDTNPRLDPNHPAYDAAFADELEHEEAVEEWRRGPGNEPKPSRWSDDRERFHSDL